MLKKILFVCLFSFGSFAYFAQQISGKVYSKNTSEPIEKVAIATNLNNGTSTNVFGIFNLNLKNSNSVTFSCLGYVPKTLSIKALKKLNFTVYLDETINQLAEIKLHITKISLDSLRLKATKSMQENYISKAIQQDIYSLVNAKIEFQKLELDLKSSSIMSRKNRKVAQYELEKFSTQLLNQNPKFSKEFKGEISSKKVVQNKTGELITFQNVNTLFAYKKNTLNEDLPLSYIQEKLQNIVLKHLKKNKTYKIKSGLFKIEDSLTFAKVIKINNTYQEFEITASKRNIESNGLFINQKNEKNFFNQKYYQHQLEKNEFLGTQKYYVISFTPKKSKAKFSGKVYVGEGPQWNDERVVNQVDGITFNFPNLLNDDEVEFATVDLIEQKATAYIKQAYDTYYCLDNYPCWNRTSSDKAKHKMIFNLPAQSHTGYLSRGWIEDGFCVSGQGTAEDYLGTGIDADCIQRTVEPDFSAQAIWYEGVLRAISKQTYLR